MTLLVPIAKVKHHFHSPEVPQISGMTLGTSIDNHLLATWTCFSGEEKAFTRNLWITKWDMTVIKTREPFDRFNWNNRTWQRINTNIIFCFTYQPYFEQRYHDQFKCKAGIPWSLDWWRTRFTQGHEIVVQCAQGSSRAPLDKKSLFGFNFIKELKNMSQVFGLK